MQKLSTAIADHLGLTIHCPYTKPRIAQRRGQRKSLLALPDSSRVMHLSIAVIWKLHNSAMITWGDGFDSWDALAANRWKPRHTPAPSRKAHVWSSLRDDSLSGHHYYYYCPTNVNTSPLCCLLHSPSFPHWLPFLPTPNHPLFPTLLFPPVFFPTGIISLHISSSWLA